MKQIWIVILILMGLSIGASIALSTPANADHPSSPLEGLNYRNPPECATDEIITQHLMDYYGEVHVWTGIDQYGQKIMFFTNVSRQTWTFIYVALNDANECHKFAASGQHLEYNTKPPVKSSLNDDRI